MLAYPIRMVIRLLVWSCRFEVTGGENILSSGRAIVMLWHSGLVLIGPGILKAAPKQTFCAFISNSKDGDIMAAYTTSYGIGRCIRVPHDAKNAALKSLIDRLKYTKDIAIITPDGPRGPACKIKPGIAIAAKETGAKVIPFSWEANKYWELGTWDKMRIPKPFSKIRAAFGEPIALSKESSLEEDLLLLASRMKS
jgi:lysophospholipid acyltransferase (LPLAT)-like uncharacterized protein